MKLQGSNFSQCIDFLNHLHVLRKKTEVLLPPVNENPQNNFFTKISVNAKNFESAFCEILNISFNLIFFYNFCTFFKFTVMNTTN